MQLFQNMQNNFTLLGSRGHPTNVTVPQSLGLLVAILKQIVTQFFATVDALKQLQHKIDTVNEMTAEELKQASIGFTIPLFFGFILYY